MGWALCILIGCLLPGKDLPDSPLLSYDKVIHIVIFAILCILMHYGWNKQAAFEGLRRSTGIKILVSVFIYGFVIEVLQDRFTEDRIFDLMDALANGAGALAGTGLTAIKSKVR